MLVFYNPFHQRVDYWLIFDVTLKKKKNLLPHMMFTLGINHQFDDQSIFSHWCGSVIKEVPPKTTIVGGQNGQIPQIFEIFCKKILFQNYTGKYHFLWNSSFLNLSSVGVLPPWHYWDGNWAIKKNYVVLEHGKLEYHATQYSNIPGSSTIL